MSILLPFEVHFFESTMEALYEHVGIYLCSDSEATCQFSRSPLIKFLEVASHSWRSLPKPCKHVLQRVPKSRLAGLILESFEGGIEFCLLLLVLDMLADLVSPAPINVLKSYYCHLCITVSSHSSCYTKHYVELFYLTLTVFLYTPAKHVCFP